MALLRERCAGACRLDAFGRTAHLARRLTDTLGRLEAQTRDPLNGLLALDLSTRMAGLLVAAAERITHSHSRTPGGVIGRERLAERRTETPVAGADKRAGKNASREELRAGEAAAAIRRFEPDVRQPLIPKELHVRFRVLEVVRRAREI